MSTFLLCGDPAYWNYAQRFASATTSSPSASATYVLANLADGIPGKPFAWTSYNATSRVDFDLMALTNGTFEVDLTGWTDTDSGGTSARTTTAGEFRTGVAALELDATGGAASRTQDVTVRAGESWKITYYGRGDGAAGAVKLRVFNMETGNWLASGGASWSSTQADAATAAVTAAYADQSSVTFTVETYQECNYQDTVSLRIEFYCSTGVGQVDDIEMYPGVNLLSVHGHTIPSIYTLMLRSSTDAFAAVDTLQESTDTTTRPACFLYESSGLVYRRYWRLRINWGGTVPSGTYSPTPASIGEAVLAQVSALSVRPRHPQLASWSRGQRHTQIRNVTATGAAWVHTMTSFARRELRLPWQTVTAAEDRAVIVDLWRRSDGGRHPVLVIPDESEDLVIYGRFAGEVGSERAFGGVGAPGYRTDLVIVEDALPAVGA